MDLPFDKSKKNDKEPHLIPLERKSLTETDKAIYQRVKKHLLLMTNLNVRHLKWHIMITLIIY